MKSHYYPDGAVSICGQLNQETFFQKKLGNLADVFLCPMTYMNTKAFHNEPQGGNNNPASTTQYTIANLAEPDPRTEPHRPEFIRLPKGGQLCNWTGLSRSALNAVILPTVANRFQPPVRSFVLRKAGAKTGIRLISFQSLISYIHAHEDHALADLRANDEIVNTAAR
jgi:hypothetical protein